MELRKITPEMREALRAEFPVNAYKQHPTKTYLGTLKPQFIVERLNDVFGIGRWSIETTIAERSENEVLMKGTFIALDYDVTVPSQYGSHTTSGKNVELADGFKSAMTDCLSKCASYLEIGNNLFKGNIDFSNGKITLKEELSILTTKNSGSYKQPENKKPEPTVDPEKKAYLNFKGKEYNLDDLIKKTIPNIAELTKDDKDKEIAILSCSEDLFDSFFRAFNSGDNTVKKINNIMTNQKSWIKKKDVNTKALDKVVEYFLAKIVEA